MMKKMICTLMALMMFCGLLAAAPPAALAEVEAAAAEGAGAEGGAEGPGSGGAPGAPDGFREGSVPGAPKGDDLPKRPQGDGITGDGLSKLIESILSGETEIDEGLLEKLAGMTGEEEPKGVSPETVVEADFIDPVFRAKVRGILGILRGESIRAGDAAGFKGSLDVSGLDINSLAGIEYFTSLTSLDCSYNRLTSLDVSACVSLEELYCNDNYLRSLDVAGIKYLSVLECSSNRLAYLDLSGLYNLDILLCGGNRLAELKLTDQGSLRILECCGNNLTGLYLPAMPSLEWLNCSDNMLETLSAAPPLTSLAAALPGLKNLNCGGNFLTVLSALPSGLQNLCCRSNLLQELDLSALNQLVYLACQENRIQNMALSATARYTGIDLRYNRIPGLSSIINNDRSRIWDRGDFLYTPQTHRLFSGVQKIRELPVMVTKGAALPMKGKIHGGSGDQSISWALADWSGDAGTKPSLVGGVLQGDTSGTAVVKASVADGKAPGAAYTQYFKVAVAEPLAFAGGKDYNIPATQVGQAIAPIYLTTGLSGSIPSWNFSVAGQPGGSSMSMDGHMTGAEAAEGLPEGLSLREDGLIYGTPTQSCPAGTATIIVEDDFGQELAITIAYGAMTGTATTKPGDINGDGEVNYLDLSLLLAEFGKSGDAITVKAADLNGDGEINYIDLSILLANFGT